MKSLKQLSLLTTQGTTNYARLPRRRYKKKRRRQKRPLLHDDSNNSSSYNYRRPLRRFQSSTAVALVTSTSTISPLMATLPSTPAVNAFVYTSNVTVSKDNWHQFPFQPPSEFTTVKDHSVEGHAEHSDIVHSSPFHEYFFPILVLFPIITILGNALVVLLCSIMVSNQWTRNESMRKMSVARGVTPTFTATNFYLISLASADLLIGGLVMPFALYLEWTDGIWNLGNFACDMWLTIDHLASTASILSLAAIAQNRYLAIAKPIIYTSLQRKRRLLFLGLPIGIVWSIAVAVSLPIVLGLNNIPDRQPEYCKLYRVEYLLYTSVVSFFIPSIIIGLQYVAVFRALGERTKRMMVRKVTTVISRINRVSSGLGLDVSINNDRTTDNQPSVQWPGIVPVIKTEDTAYFNKPGPTKRYPSNSGNNCPTIEVENSGGFDLFTIQHSKKSRRLSEPLSAPIKLVRSSAQLTSFRSPTKPVTNGCLSRSLSLQALSSQHHHQQSAISSHILRSAASPPSLAPITAPGTNSDMESFDRSAEMSDDTFQTLPAVFRPRASTSDKTTTRFTVEDPSLKLGAYLRGSSTSYGRDSEGAIGRRRYTISRRLSITGSMVKAAGSRSLRRLGTKITRERRATVMLTIVLVLFYVCWVPYFIVTIMKSVCAHFESDSGHNDQCIPDIVMHGLAWLGHANSMINPFVYAVFNAEFRSAFHQLIGRHFYRVKNGQSS